MKKSIKNEKGITLVSVVIIVIVLIILASIATVSGISTVKFAQYTAFKTELQLLQNEVNALKQDKSNDELLAYGVEMTDSQKDIFSVNEISSVLNGKEGDINTIENDFRYFSQEYLTKNLGIDGITKDYYINLKERIIIATEPVTYEDVDYYMLEQIENGGYNVQYNNQIGELTFEATGEPTNDGGKIIISNVNYTGYIDKWEVQYRLQGDENWKDAGEFTGSTYTFEVTQSGTYEVILKHGDEVQSELLTAEVIDSIYIVSNEQRQVTNNGYTAQIPSGFAVVPGCEDITGGLVISDTSNDTNNQGNQYVWIPIDGVLQEAEGDGGKTIQDAVNGEIVLGRYVFDENGNIDKELTPAILDEKLETGKDSLLSFIEYSIDGHQNKPARELKNFIQSVRDNGGYYIARYEAGVVGYDEQKVESQNINGDPNWTGYVAKDGENLKLVTKKGVQPWNNITQHKASDMCQDLFSTIKSDLVNSYAWDTAILFIQKNQMNSEKKYSRQNGLSLSSDVSLTGEGKLNDTGEIDKKNNIYDLAGNCCEWTTETVIDVSNPSSDSSTTEGGLFSSDIDYTSTRSTLYKEGKTTSFRPILYF